MMLTFVLLGYNIWLIPGMNYCFFWTGVGLLLKLYAAEFYAARVIYLDDSWNDFLPLLVFNATTPIF